MVSESICLAILQFMRGRKLTLTTVYDLDDPEKATRRQSTDEDAAADSHIYRQLLGQYDLAVVSRMAPSLMATSGKRRQISTGHVTEKLPNSRNMRTFMCEWKALRAF